MKKDHFAKLYDEETNTYAYEEVVWDLSKNNRFTDQDLRFGGCIPYENMEMGKNLFWFYQRKINENLWLNDLKNFLLWKKIVCII